MGRILSTFNCAFLLRNQHSTFLGRFHDSQPYDRDDNIDPGTLYSVVSLSTPQIKSLVQAKETAKDQFSGGLFLGKSYKDGFWDRLLPFY